MQLTKRWLAAVLAMTMTLSDCGGITAFATENDETAISSVSENDAGFDEIQSDQLDVPEVESEICVSPNMALPALHIGQIKKGANLPAPDDDEFVYDLPVSFETTDHLVLFVNYSIDSTLKSEENATVSWSILRGEKGSEPGSASLLDEEDDWTGFETVSASPFFVMEEITDEESEYYQMMAIAPAENSSAIDNAEGYETGETPEKYNYYIRAAYYPETENAESESFYAAVTVPFLSENIADIEPTQEDVSDAEKIPTDSILDETSVSENTTCDEETLSNETDTEKGEPEETQESADTENPEDNSSPAEIFSLSENNMMKDASALSEDDTTPEAEDPVITSLTLDKTNITLQPKKTVLITAKYTVDPADTPVTVLWESDDDTVATVNEEGLITAVAEGYAKITASCYGATASVMVDVVLDTEHPDNAKLLDLSGSIRVAGFQKESDNLVYTGQKITQDLRVYYDETLLKEKTDYTLTYKNNINAAAWNTVKAPSVTITLKGQYSGSVTLYYTIKPLDINKIDIYSTTGSKSPGYEQAVNYSKKLNIPNPVLSFGKKKLAANKDFVCDYATPDENFEAMPADYKNGDAYSYDNPQKVYSYTVKGIGNFTGSFPMQLVVLKDKNKNFSSASIKLDKNKYQYQGKPLTKEAVKITQLKIGNEILTDKPDIPLYDYEVCAYGLEGAYVKVYPSEAGINAGYHGCKQVNLKLEGDRQIKDALLGENWQESILFSQKTVDKYGGMFQPEDGLLVFDAEEGKKEPLTEGIDYAIKYSNAQKAGKVTVTFTGKGRYKGSLRKTYTITPNCFPKDLKLIWGENVTRDSDGNYTVSYQKGGASPALSIRDKDYVFLNSKTDYSVKLSGKKIPDTILTCTITGKGNYKGYTETVEFTVTKADISKATLSVLDKPYDTKPDKWKSAVTVTDVNGKKLTAKTDYSKDIDYDYENIESKPIPDAGTAVTVTVTGTGYYDGTLTLKDGYRIYEKAKDISQLKVKIDDQIYTGKEITLTKDHIHFYATNNDLKKGENELPKSCFEIIDSGYKNNIKAGTAKVTLHGVGEYGGTKTYSFKILKKAYLINRVAKISLDKANLNISLAEKEKRTLTATITPVDMSHRITNPTVIWSTSNSNIATVDAVETAAGNKSDTETNTNDNNTVTAAITVQKAGTVTITATTQDGNKKATCRIKISTPVLKQAGQTIKGKAGDTYQLSFVGNGDDEIIADSLLFESDNPTVASVDNTGLITLNRFGATTIKVYVGSNQPVQQCYVIVERAADSEPNDNKVLKYTQVSDCDDDTKAINNLLRQAEWSNGRYDTVYIPAGTYHIDAVSDFGGLVLTDNQNLIMSPDAKLIANKNRSKNYQVIYAFGRSNITISGGQIIGERNDHEGSGGEWGHGINISGCTNVYISNVEVSQCWGDGIYLGFYDGPNVCSNGVTIENCNLHHNRRNNLSITDVSNVTIRNCRFDNANGTDPQYGIDIEPNAGRPCKNIRIYNCTFTGNKKASMGIMTPASDIRLEDCNLDGQFINWSGTNVVLKNTTVRGGVTGKNAGIVKRE